MRSILGWALRLVAVASALVLALPLAAVFFLQTEAARAWLRDTAADALGEAFGARVEIADWKRAGGLGVEAEDIAIEIDGRPFAVVDRVVARPAFPSLWPPTLSIALEVSGFDARIGRGPDGRFDVERLTFGGEEDTEESGSTVTDVRFEVTRGTIRIEDVADEPLVFADVAGKGEVALEDVGAEELRLVRLGGRIGDLALAVSGALGLGDEQVVSAEVSAEGRPGEVLARVTGFPAALDLVARSTVSGTLERPVSELHAESGDAALDARTTLATTDSGDTAIESSWQIARVDPARFVPDAPAGELTGEGTVSFAPALGLAGLRGEARLHDSTLADTRFEQLALRTTAVDGRLEIQVDAAAPAGAYAASAVGTLDPNPPHAFTAKGDLTLEDASALPGALSEWLAASHLRGRFDVSGVQVLEPTRSLNVGIELDPGEVRGLRLTRGEARAELSGDLLRVDALDVVAERTRLRGSGRVELDPSGIVEARVEGPVDLRLVPGANASGVVDAELAASGRLDALDAKLRVASTDRVGTPEVGARLRATAEVRGLGTGQATGTLEATGDAAPKGDLADAIGGETRKVELAATWSESLGRDARTAAAPSRARPGEASAGRIQASFSATEPDGRDQRVAATVLLGAEQTAVELETLAIAPPKGDAWRLGRPAHLVVGTDSLSIADLEVGSRAGLVRADGTLRRGTGRNDLRTSVRGIDLSFVCLLAGVREPCAGLIQLDLTARGTGAAPEIDGQLEIQHVKIDERKYGDVHAELRADRRFRVTLAVGGGTAPDLRAEGSVALTPGPWLPSIDWRGPIEGWARAAALPLDGLVAFTGGALEDVDGRAAIDVRVGGTLDQPRAAGEAKVSGLLVAVAATGATYRDGSASILLTSDAVRIADLTLADGSVRGGGSIGLDGFTPDSFDLWLQLDDAPLLSRPEAEGHATGRIALQGKMATPRLEGEIVVGPATVRPRLRAAGGGPEADPTIQVIRGPEEEAEEPEDTLGLLLAGQPAKQGAEEAKERAPREPSFFDDLAIRVAVRVGDGVLIRRTDAYLRLTGHLDVDKDPGGDLQVVGVIESAHGWYIFQGRRLEIERAAVRFSGEWPIDPELDVNGTARSGGYDVTVQVHGTVSEPELNLSSSPPLDQGDILSVLLFGKPASELSGGQGQVLQQQALGLLASYVAPQLQKSIMDTFGLAAVTISMPGGDRAGTVGVGRYFGNDLFVSLAQDFGGPKGGTQRQLQGLIGTSVTVQYSLTRSITLQTASSTEGESSVDVIWHRRY